MSKHKFFDNILKNDTKLILVSEIGNIAKNHFVDNFRKQGFVDDTLVKWKEVQRRQRKSGTVASRTNPILQGKGAGKLRKLKVVSLTYNSIKVHTTTDTDKYAKIHNEGLKTRGKNLMPKRQFMGDSKALDEKIKSKIKSQIKQYFK